MYQKLPFQPGIHKDDSPLEAKGYWVDADKIRFVAGNPETIYGWERASSSTLLGICRGAFTWADNSRNPFACFGTHLRLYAMDVDGNVYDITPVVSRAQAASISFTTTMSNSMVTAAWTGHGLAADQKFTFDAASPVAVGGVTIDGTFTVATVVDANTITFSAAQAAASSAGPTAVTLNTRIYLPPGQTDGLGGLGYGTGGYGTGGYGGSASGYTLYPRTWSLSQWGQNLIANPRGGGMYEWAPNVSASELVSNGTFTGSATGWTLGAGIAYSANAITYTASSGAATQSVTTLPGAWHEFTMDVAAWSTGSIQAVYNGSNIISAITASGTYRGTFFSGAGGTATLSISGTNATATVDNVSLKVLAAANIISNAPTQVTCSFVTAERILVACGCPDSNGNFDALRLRWTTTQNNQTWTQVATNLAGSYTLSNGARIVRGISGNRENLILTDTAAYAMRYVPDPNVVYSFPELGSGCGLIGPNALTQVAGRFFWMSPAAEFYAYDGSYPQPLQCSVKRDVKDNLAWVQQDKVFAFPVAARNEVWWLYPDSRDGNECSRYVIYNFVENHWSVGTFDRTAWADAGAYQYPLAVDDDGRVWFQEKGFTEDGAARSWSVTSAFVDFRDGDSHARLVGIQPDADDLQGGYGITVTTRIHNGDGVTSRTFGPYDVTTATGKVSARANGQEAALKFAGTAAPAFWRLGAVRVDLEDTGRRR